MTTRKLFVLLLSVVFLFGTAGPAAAAQHEKAAGEKKMEKAEKKPAAKAKNANGTVKAASADTVTVVDKDKKEWTFSVGAKTSIKKAGKAITAADLKEGDPVNVRFADADGKMMAQAITVRAAGTAKKVEKKAEQPCAAKAKQPCAVKK